MIENEGFEIDDDYNSHNPFNIQVPSAQVLKMRQSYESGSKIPKNKIIGG